MTSSFDIAIIGGGPGGAAAGTLLARKGYRVALFEKEEFPRFHIGESLIPAVNLTLERIGVLDRMDEHGFPRKHGVQFFSPRGPGRPFYFSEVSDPRLHRTWQVLRSDFDAMLLSHASEAGAHTFVGTKVVGVEGRGDVVEGVRVVGHDGAERIVDARVVIDASGQKGVIAQRLGGRRFVEGLQNASVFAHYRGARLDPGIDAGSTLIFRLETRAWLWFIPLPGAASVGLVAPAKRIGSFGDSAQEILDKAIAAAPDLAERLRGATRCTEASAVRDFTYRAARDGGPGWALVGDALGFIDPIYSTGLFLGLHSAELAADAIDRQLSSGGRADLSGYASVYDEAFERFLILVRAYYREGFRFGEFSKDAPRRQGLVDLLTGLVSTPEAILVAELLRESCEDERAPRASLS